MTTPNRAFAYCWAALLCVLMAEWGCTLNGTTRTEATRYALLTASTAAALQALDNALQDAQAMALGALSEAERAQAYALIDRVHVLRNEGRLDIHNAQGAISFLIDSDRLDWYVDKAQLLYHEGRAFYEPRIDTLSVATQRQLRRVDEAARRAHAQWVAFNHARQKLRAGQPGIADATQTVVAAIRLATELARALQ